MQHESLVKPPRSAVLRAGKVTLASGESVGWHTTEQREELIIVLEGTATLLEKKDEGVIETEVSPGSAHYIQEGVEHDVRNDASEQLEYLYVVALFGVR